MICFSSAFQMRTMPKSSQNTFAFSSNNTIEPRALDLRGFAYKRRASTFGGLFPCPIFCVFLGRLIHTSLAESVFLRTSAGGWGAEKWEENFAAKNEAATIFISFMQSSEILSSNVEQKKSGFQPRQSRLCFHRSQEKRKTKAWAWLNWSCHQGWKISAKTLHVQHETTF